MSAGAVPSAVAVLAQSIVAVAAVAVLAQSIVAVAAGAVALVAIALAVARENDW